MRMKRRIKSALKYIPLCLAGLFFLVPFIWLISTSLKSSDQIFFIPAGMDTEAGKVQQLQGGL